MFSILSIILIFPVPDSSPLDIRCSAQSSQSIRIRWEPPPLENRNGIIQGYKVIYKQVNPKPGKRVLTNVNFYVWEVLCWEKIMEIYQVASQTYLKEKKNIQGKKNLGKVRYCASNSPSSDLWSQRVLHC